MKIKVYIDYLAPGEIFEVLLGLPRFLIDTAIELRWNWYFFPYEIATPLDFDGKHRERLLAKSRRRMRHNCNGKRPWEF